MNGSEAWDRFWGSGRVDDYLLYAGSAEKPDIGAADMVAMNNAAELSGIGGANTMGLNTMAAMARQEQLNAGARVEDLSGEGA